MKTGLKQLYFDKTESNGIIYVISSSMRLKKLFNILISITYYKYQINTAWVIFLFFWEPSAWVSYKKKPKSPW